MTTIKEARQAAGLTQQGVTDTLGIPRRTLQDWETGKKKQPRTAVIEKGIDKVFKSIKRNVLYR